MSIFDERATAPGRARVPVSADSASGERAVPVHRLLANGFATQTTGPVFALMGDANMYWLSDLSESLPIVYGRHEAGVVAMADGFARANDRVGVCAVTCGPGVTNTLTSLRAAVINRTPLVVFAGDTPSNEVGHLQEFDTEAFAALAGACHIRIAHPGDAVSAVADAFETARSERTPVILSVPMDVQEARVAGDADAEPAPVEVGSPPLEPSSTDVEALARLLGGRRCVVLLGSGALDPAALGEAAELADLLEGSVGNTIPALGALARHPRSIGIVGGFSTPAARSVLAAAEVVLVVGASLSRHTTDDEKLFPQALIARIDTAPASRFADVDLHVRADARATLSCLNRRLRDSPTSRPVGVRGDETPISRSMPDPYVDVVSVEERDKHGNLDPIRLMNALSEAVPGEAEIVVGAGHFWNYVVEGFTPRAAGRIQFHYQFGAIAQGFPAGLGVASTRPAAGTIALEGDGSLLMSLAEMETWARHELPLLLFVLNDGAYGAEVHKLASRGHDPRSAVFGYTPFAGLATALGIEASTPTSITDAEASVRNYFAHPRPMLIDARISPYDISEMYGRFFTTPMAGRG